jgi:hypothetical protein
MTLAASVLFLHQKSEKNRIENNQFSDKLIDSVIPQLPNDNSSTDNTVSDEM